MRVQRLLGRCLLTLLLFSGIIWLTPAMARPYSAQNDRSLCIRGCFQICRNIARACVADCDGFEFHVVPECRFDCWSQLPGCAEVCRNACRPVEEEQPGRW